MRIAFDGRSIHRNLGGIGVAALALVRSLVALGRGHELTLLLGSSLPDVLRFPASLRVLRCDAAMIDQRFEQFELPSLLEDLQADVYINPAFSMPAIKTAKFNLPIIHDVVFEERPEWVEPSLCEYLRKWSRFSARAADRIVTVSQYSKSRIAAVYNVESERIVVIPNGVSVVNSADAADNNAELLAAREIVAPYVLYLGSIEIKKGIPELLRAFACLTGRGFPGQLVLAGAPGGPAFDLNSAIGDTGCPERIRHLGYVDETLKWALLRNCAAFVYPSHYEGFGLPPLEAMALGKPCVVNNATSLPEIAGDCALLADVANVERFADVMEKALQDEAVKARSAAAGPEWAKRFSWDAAAAAYLSLCESLEAA